jgi:nucleotide-binding universal stress UspA family protein
MGLFRRILIAFDGSPGSERALLLAVQLAGEQGAELVIISVVEHLPRFAGTVGEVEESMRERVEALRQQQERAVRLAQEHGGATPKMLLVTGHAAQLIVSAAEQEHADLLALGRSGHSEVWGRFMGSTADKIARHAPCSVLIAH